MTDHFYQSRLLCYVLDDMRACCKVRNYGPMEGLIEEVQIMGNRMEAKLDESKSYFELLDDIKKLLKTKKRLKNDVKDLEKKTNKHSEPQESCKSW